MEYNLLKTTDVWAILRQKEKDNGLNHLSFTERDILENLAYIIGDDKQISLEIFLKKCKHPRATFFRSLKVLREQKFIKILKHKDDRRKSSISLTKNINK